MTAIAGAVVLALVLAEGFIRAGRAALRIVPGGGRGPGVTAARLVTGWFVTGTAMLGLAAAGIFRPAAVAGLVAGLVVAGVVAGGWRPALPPVAGWLVRLDRRAAAVIALLLGVLALRANTPELEGDCHLYHLALSDGWRAGGKLLIDHIPFAQHLPLPFDAAFAIPVLLGDDRIARWLVLLAFVGGLGLAERKGTKPMGILLGVAFVLSGYQPGRFATVAKNDVVAAVALAAGVIRLADGRKASGWMLCGLGIAGKLVYGPVAAVAVAAWRPKTLRAAAATAALLVLPVLPWWIKSGLALGHPFVPALAGWFPVVGWDARNWEAVYLHQRGFWIEQVWTPGSFLNAYALTWREESLMLALAVPFGLVAGGGRVLGVALAGGAVTLFAGHVARYLLPATWLVALAVGRAMGGSWRGRRPQAAAVCLLGLAAYRLAIRPDQGQPGWRDAFRPPRALQDAHSAARAELARWIELTRPGRVLTVGEVRADGFHGRVIYGGALGETPVMWRLSRESRDAEGIAKRVRQLGVTTIVYNYVTAIWNRKYMYKFSWDDDQLGRYVGFCGALTRPVWASDHFDFTGGGYVALAVDRNGKPGKGPVPYLPGTEMLSMVGYDPAKGQEGQVSLNRAIELTVKFPRALPMFADLGDFQAKLGRWREAYDAILPVWKAGVRNSTSMAAFGSAAGRIGRFEEAESGFRAAAKAYASGSNDVPLALAETMLGHATVEGRAGRMDRAIELSLGAAEVLRPLSPPATPEEADRRAAILSVALGLRADIAFARGRIADAADLYRQALSQGPHVPGRDAWAERLRRMERMPR